MSMLGDIGADLHAAVVGASGGIGAALVATLAADPAVRHVVALARTRPERSRPNVSSVAIDIADETSIRAAAEHCAGHAPLDIVLVATGVLHELPDWRPEKTWSELDAHRLAHVFAVNAIGPALVAKHFLPLLNRERRSIFAALSARVGSISDNRLGGWYGYRASKAALNMMIRTLAIELARQNPRASCVALHPGTVATGLSAPFRSRVPAERLFTPRRAARQLVDVIARITPERSGSLVAWDGRTIDP